MLNEQELRDVVERTAIGRNEPGELAFTADELGLGAGGPVGDDDLNDLVSRWPRLRPDTRRQIARLARVG